MTDFKHLQAKVAERVAEQQAEAEAKRVEQQTNIDRIAAEFEARRRAEQEQAEAKAAEKVEREARQAEAEAKRAAARAWRAAGGNVADFEESWPTMWKQHLKSATMRRLTQSIPPLIRGRDM